MKKILALLLALVMVLALCACGAGDSASDTAADAAADTSAADTAAESTDGKKVLRIGTTETAQSFDPAGTGGLPMNLAYEFLSTADGTGATELWLAESMEWLDDTTMQIVLRDGIYFANGDQMTGEDVIYSIQYAATAPGYMIAQHFSRIDFDASYVEDDGLTVVLKTTAPDSELLTWLSAVYLTDKSEAETRSSDEPSWWDEPISSSAYELVENVDGSHATFVARDDYWDTENPPQWDEIVFNYYSNATAMFIAFENGELDLVLKADVNDYDRVLEGDVTNPDTTSTFTVPVNSIMAITLSSYCEYFQDAKVREAVAHAVDPAAVATVAYGSLAEAGVDSILSPLFATYTSVGADEYDIELAKQCMAESAYPDGFEINCVALANDGPALVVMQACLAEIGITVNIETLDFAAWIASMLQEGATDISLVAGAHNVSDLAALNSYTDDSSMAGTRVLDEEFNALYDEVYGTFDETERQELFTQMQERMYETKWVIPMCEFGYAIVYNNSVLECTLDSCSTCGYVQFDCVPVG